MQKDILSIMIGSSPAAIDAMRRDLGGTLHIFDTRSRCAFFLRRNLRYHKMSGVEPDIVAMYLKSLCAEYPDRLAVVGASPEYLCLLDTIAHDIESFCVILREDNLERCKALKNSGTDR